MADNLETRTPEQLKRATAVSPQALTFVQEPGGNVQGLEVRRLFGKLLQVDTAYEQEAAPTGLQGDLDHDEFSVGFVFADPAPEKNGWWRKVGAPGAGNWVQFEHLSSHVLDLIGDLSDEIDVTAASVFAAAASVYVSSYAHEFSQGDRTVSLLANGGYIRTDLNIASGTLNNLIDGATANSDADGVNFGAGQDVTNKAIWEIGFPVPRALLCDEWQALFSASANWGTSKLQLRKIDGTWVDASADAATGGATTATRTATSADKTGYLGVRQWGTGGTTAAGRFIEIKLKLANGIMNGEARVPPTLLRGQVPTASPVSGELVPANPIDYNEAAVAGAGLLRELFFNEGSGEIVYDRSGNKNHLTFDAAHRATYGGALGVNYMWTRRGLRLKKAMIQGASLGIKTAVRLYRTLREDGSNVQWNISSNTAIGSNHCHHGNVGHTQNTQTVWTGHGGESFVPLWRDGSGNASFAISRGGWTLVVSESASIITGNAAFGGQANVVSDALRATEIEWAYSADYSGSVAANLDRIRTGLRRACAPRGITFDWRDCDEYLAGLIDGGQSNVGNLSIPYSGLSAPYKAALAYTPNTYIITCARTVDAAPMAMPQQYRAGFNSFPGFQADGVGFEAGLALAHEKAYATHRRQLSICKSAPGGANVANAGGGVLDWQGAPSISRLGQTLKTFRDMEQHWLNQGKGLRLFAVNFQNGEQEANDTGVANGWPALYQAGMQVVWDKIKEQHPFAGMKLNVGELFPWQLGQTNYTQAGVDAVKAAQASLVLANADASLVASAPNLKQPPPDNYVHLIPDKAVDRGQFDFYPVCGII
jgi:hypothetical protein